MIDWTVEVEDVACLVDDMRKVAWTAFSDSCVQREWCEGMGDGRTMMEGTVRTASILIDERRLTRPDASDVSGLSALW